MSYSTTIYVWYGIKPLGLIHDTGMPVSVYKKLVELKGKEAEDEITEVLSQVVQDFGCDLVCYGDFRIEGTNAIAAFVKSINGSLHTPIELHMNYLQEVPEEWNASLKELSETIDWQWSEPCWYISSSIG